MMLVQYRVPQEVGELFWCRLRESQVTDQSPNSWIKVDDDVDVDGGDDDDDNDYDGDENENNDDDDEVDVHPMERLIFPPQ